MPKHRVLTEFGMGSSLRRQDYTQAARRALQDALWHNSINMAEVFGLPKESMIIDVEIGVAKPDEVDTDALKDMPRPDGRITVIANAAINVSFEMERT